MADILLCDLSCRYSEFDDCNEEAKDLISFN